MSKAQGNYGPVYAVVLKLVTYYPGMTFTGSPMPYPPHITMKYDYDWIGHDEASHWVAAQWRNFQGWGD